MAKNTVNMFDQLAAEMTAEATRPEGWVTIAEFMALCKDGKIGRRAAMYRLDDLVNEGKLAKRKFRMGDGRSVSIYGPPEKG